MCLAIDSQHFSICINHCHGIELRISMPFEETDGKHYMQLSGHGAEMTDCRIFIRVSSQIQILEILRLTKIRSFE